MSEQAAHKLQPIGVEEAATRIIRELHDLADPTKEASTQRFFAEPIQALGIDAPTARNLAQGWIRQLKPSWHAREALALCGLLLQQPHIETRGTGFLILGGFLDELGQGMWRQAEVWLKGHLDNWALVDGFASAVLSPLLRCHPACIAELQRWSKSNCMWVRRAAVVTLVSFARQGEHLDLAYKLTEALLEEERDLMHKAVGWLLREAGKTNPQRLKTFLLLHRGAIPRTTVPYAIERFPEQERKELLERTRSGDRRARARRVA